MTADLAQDFLKMFLMELGGSEVEIIARTNIHHARQNPTIMFPSDGHPRLLSDQCPHRTQRGHLREDGRIEKQDHRPAPVFQALFEPPFA